MRRTLVLLRHAKSDWSGGEPDRERPLARRGRRQAPDAGRWLAAHLGAVDLAVVSPARRALETWELVATELDQPPPVRVEPAVYAAADVTLLEVVRGLPEPARVAVLVGHNPGLEDLLWRLTGADEALVTAALAVVELGDTGWPAAGSGAGRLLAVGRPPTPR